MAMGEPPMSGTPVLEEDDVETECTCQSARDAGPSELASAANKKPKEVKNMYVSRIVALALLTQGLKP